MATVNRSEFHANAQLQRATRGAAWVAPSRTQRRAPVPRFTRAHAFILLGVILTLAEVFTLYL